MQLNTFQQWQKKKEDIKALYEKAADFGWITAKEKEQIIQKIDSDVLTIGIIGQMKSGKSTFLNAWVFEEEILPAATTPMTAALTLIKYGDKKELEAEFYSPAEWKEQEMLASQDLNNENLSEMQKRNIQAAQETMQRAKPLGNAVKELLGTKQKDTLNHLAQYAGADGKYTPITKCITIYSPQEYLKGVEIVDTPGFNDPIVAREERTKAFLKKADAVVVLLCANQPFSANDQDLIFQTCASAGIGHILIGINKYDLPYEDPQKPQMPEEIENYVAEGIKQACREQKRCEEDFLKVFPKAFSAELAFLSKINMEDIDKDPVKKQMWNRHCENLEIATQKEMFEKSRFDIFTPQVLSLIEKDKANILITKPMATLKALAIEKIKELDNQIAQNKAKLNNLQQPDDELEERQSKLGRTQRRLSRKLDDLSVDIEGEFRSTIRRGKRDLEDAVHNTAQELIRKINDSSIWFTDPEDLKQLLESEINYLHGTTLERKTEDLGAECKSSIVKDITTFLAVAQNILLDCFEYLNDSADSEETQELNESIIKQIKDKVLLEIQNDDFFEPEAVEKEEQNWVDILLEIAELFPTVKLAEKIDNVLSLAKKKRELIEILNNMEKEFNPSLYLDTVFSVKDKVIEFIRLELIDHLLNPLQKQIDHILEDKENRTKQLQQTQEELVTLTQNKNIWQKQKEELGI